MKTSLVLASLSFLASSQAVMAGTPDVYAQLKTEYDSATHAATSADLQKLSATPNCVLAMNAGDTQTYPEMLIAFDSQKNCLTWGLYASDTSDQAKFCGNEISTETATDSIFTAPMSFTTEAMYAFEFVNTKVYARMNGKNPVFKISQTVQGTTASGAATTVSFDTYSTCD